jgi:chaperone BCS1
MSVVDVRPDDECYNFLMSWVANQRFSQGARRFVVNTNLNSVSHGKFMLPVVRSYRKTGQNG